jgi:two-component system, sensor histidine kinase and response regulator
MSTRIFRDIFEFLLGDKNEFSLQVRSFHFTCLSAFTLVLIGVIQNLLLGFLMIGLTMFVVNVSLVIVFVFSRFYNKRKGPVISFLVVCELIISANYFLNSGVDGPTLMVFFVALVFMIAITKNSWHVFLVLLNILIPSILLWLEYTNKIEVPSNYRNEAERYLDLGFSYGVCVIFMLLIARFVRNLMNDQRNDTLIQSKLIEEQNLQIQEANENLALLNDRFKMIFSIISHDLRSPLSSIESYLLVLKANPDLAKEDRVMLESELLKLTKGSTSLLDNLLQWSRTQVKKDSSEVYKFKVAPIIRSVCSLMGPIAGAKNIIIHDQVEDDLIAIGNEHQIEVVLRNLIQNAIKFSPLSSHIYIEAKEKDDNVEFTVRDQGVGISESKAKDLFIGLVSPSYGTSNEKGAGIGLLLSAEFVALQNGRIWIEETSSQGTKIKFTLKSPNISR